MTVNLINRVNKAITHYQTRQHLINLPEHLLKDIAVSTEQLMIERRKNALLNFLHHLIKGN